MLKIHIRFGYKPPALCRAPNPPIEATPVMAPFSPASPARPSRRRSLRAVVARATVSAVAFGALLSVTGGDPVVEPRTTPVADTGSTFRVGTYNVLGNSHTTATGNKPGWASGATRTGWTLKLIGDARLSVVGLQEFEPEQYDRFREVGADTYAIYPGLGHPERPIRGLANSIIWRRDTWRMIEGKTMNVPYFKGALWPMPYVLLENRKTGERAWFYNSHNPADARGPAEQYRQQGFTMEADLTKRLQKATPGIQVFLLGDKNAKENYICPVSRQVPGVRSANNARVEDGVCKTPERLWIDWISGTSGMTFSNFTPVRTELAQKTSDHPLFWADATLKSASAPVAPAAPAANAVVIAVEGLRSQSLRSAGTATPTIRRMFARGAGTWDGRTTYERTTNLPNVVSMLTGRAVSTGSGGHGVTRPGVAGTVHKAAGRYVSSVFDIVHNNGLATALFTSRSELRMVDTSWNGTNGGTDPYGADNGRDKIDVFRLGAGDTAVTDAAVSRLATGRRGLTVVHLSGPDRVGQRYGFSSERYQAALRTLDGRVSRILGAIGRNSATAGKTRVILTGTHGGSGRTHSDPSVQGNFKVPFVVTGPEVPAGVSLYSLNADLASPGDERVAYSATKQPFRNAYASQLVTEALGLPDVPGTTLTRGRTVTALR